MMSGLGDLELINRGLDDEMILEEGGRIETIAQSLSGVEAVLEKTSIIDEDGVLCVRSACSQVFTSSIVSVAAGSTTRSFPIIR